MHSSGESSCKGHGIVVIYNVYTVEIVIYGTTLGTELAHKHSTFVYRITIPLKSINMQLILAAMVEENKSLGMPCSSDFSYTSDQCYVQSHQVNSCLTPNGLSKSVESLDGTVSSDHILRREHEPSKTLESEDCGTRNLSKTDFKVFLGGSCNPTTWRYDDAIPALENMKIKYYNPQVPGNWDEDLMKEESQAKANAEVLFFVIDNQTRSVASMVEAAHIAGSSRKLILVIKEFKDSGRIRILDEDVSDGELHYLKKGRNFLWNLVENAGYPVCEDIPTALYCTACMVWLNVRPQDLRLKGTASQVEKISEQLGKNSVKNEMLKSIPGLNPSRLKEVGLVTKDGPKLIDVLTKFFSSAPIVQTVSKFVDWMLPKPECSVYLGGSGYPSRWRDDVTQLLRKNGINYVSKESSEDEQLALPESIVRNKRNIMLFVITKDTRALAAMMTAAFCVGLGLKVVLCIQYLEDGVIIDGEKLTPCAVKDYNRGRIYLRDLAEEANVPIFERVDEAAAFIVNQCHAQKG